MYHEYAFVAALGPRYEPRLYAPVAYRPAFAQVVYGLPQRVFRASHAFAKLPAPFGVQQKPVGSLPAARGSLKLVESQEKVREHVYVVLLETVQRPEEAEPQAVEPVAPLARHVHDSGPGLPCPVTGHRPPLFRPQEVCGQCRSRTPRHSFQGTCRRIPRP